MRLSEKQIIGLIAALAPFLENKNAELRLYGSRVDDNKKGGDIDLLLILDKKFADTLNLKKHYLLSAIEKEIGEQKIDLKITNLQEISEDVFLKIIYPHSISLHHW